MHTERVARASPEVVKMSRSKRHRGHEVTITGVELLADHNQENHHTHEYECPQFLIARRGAAVDIEVAFSRPLSGDSVCVDLHRGYRTSYRRGTRFTAKLGLSPSHPHQLELKELKSDGSTITLSLMLPADFPVGSYRVVVEVIAQESKNGDKQDVDRELVVLFNPWCKEDTVYLPEEADREEYIMNASGIIWAGAHNDMFTWPWNFAQFEEVSVQVVLYLLDMHNAIYSDTRKNPAKVARAITEMVNVEDGDGGILYGLWSSEDKDYEDGTDPTAWSGSLAILEEFWKTKKAVSYAQCWVFGGLLTTVLRTLGIPARPVTNFESAHDGDGNRVMDRYWNMKDELDEDKSHDSIWNYHVWVEAWMTRADLGPHYGGWQAVDATPQEISPYSDSYVVGPASLTAVKSGQSLPYDTNFVIAEVNADILDYCEVEKDKYQLAATDTMRVGKAVITKSVGTGERCDITQSYKYEEGSLMERKTLAAIEEVNRASDVEFSMEFNRQAKIGEDFDMIITAKNAAKESRHVAVRVTISAVAYIGGTGSNVKKGEDKLYLKEVDSSGVYRLSVRASDYLKSLKDHALLSVTVLAVVEETKRSWVSKVPYRLHKPNLILTVDGKKAIKDQSIKLTADNSYAVKAFFTNPLQTSLTNVVFHIEGARLTGPLKIQGKNTARGKVAEVSFTVSPKRPKKHSQESKLIVTCQSKELKGIMGTANITITK